MNEGLQTTRGERWLSLVLMPFYHARLIKRDFRRETFIDPGDSLVRPDKWEPPNVRCCASGQVR